MHAASEIIVVDKNGHEVRRINPAYACPGCIRAREHFDSEIAAIKARLHALETAQYSE